MSKSMVISEQMGGEYKDSGNRDEGIIPSISVIWNYRVLTYELVSLIGIVPINYFR